MPKKLPDTDESYLVELAYLTSRGDMTVGDAAGLMGISRSKAQEVLRWGRSQGILETTIRADRLPQHTLAARIRDAYKDNGVRQVVVLPGPASDVHLRDRPDYLSFLRHQLGSLAANVVESFPLEPGDHIALSGGRTLMEFAQSFNPRIRQLILRPLSIGGRWRSISQADAAAVLQILLWRLGYRGYEAPEDRIRVLCPEAPPGMIDAVRSQPEVQALFAEEMRPSVVVTAIGWRRYVSLNDEEADGPHPLTSSYVQLVADSTYYLEHAKRLRDDPAALYRPLKDGVYRAANAALFEADVVADINRFAISRNANGQYEVCTGFAEATSLGFHPETLARWRQAGTRSVVVLGGSALVHSLKAALALGVFDTLVVDTPLGVQLLDEDERPEQYRDVPPVPERPEVESPPKGESE
jgi:DNA-binding transcriptional regulator LsrR (DeoR family)